MGKLLGPDAGYIDLLDKQLEKQAAIEHAGRKMPLRPSSAGSCSRSLGYELAAYRGLITSEPEERSGDVHRLLNLGHFIEDHLIKQLEMVPGLSVRYKQQVVSFFQLTDGQWIEGSIDLVLWSDTFKAVADVKSKKQKFSSYNHSDWDNWNEALECMESVDRVNERVFWINDLQAFLLELRDSSLASNFYQLNMYANSQFIKERGIDHGVVLQYGKNDSQLRELRFRPSKSVYEQVKAKYLAVDKAVTDGTYTQLPCETSHASGRCFKCEALGLTDVSVIQERMNSWSDLNEAAIAPRDIEKLFARYSAAVLHSVKAAAIEGQITAMLEREKLRKVKLQNGQVWELKALAKGLVIRRAKA